MMNLYGLGASPEVQSAVDGFLSSTPSPSSGQIGDFLKLYQGADRADAATELIASGVDATKVTSAMTFLNTAGKFTMRTFWGIASVASAAASGYHGIKRNNGSIGWGLWWFLMGGMFPIATPVIAIARKPGFAKPK
jgi:hypothetical protein